MGTNPNFTVRFYVRTTKTQGGDSPTPLRVKVWVSDTKSYLYFSTKTTTTKRIWADFATDGTPSAGADPVLVKVVDAYKMATQLVMSAAIANNRIKDMTSDEMSLRVDAVVSCIQKRQADGFARPILIFTTPQYVPTCKECLFCGATCKAKWDNALLSGIASDVALYNGQCSMFQLNPAPDGNPMNTVFGRFLMNALIVKESNPELTMEEACKVVQDDMLSALQNVRYKQKGCKDNGNNE